MLTVQEFSVRGGTLEWFMGAGKAGDECRRVPPQCHVLTQQILGTGSGISPVSPPLLLLSPTFTSLMERAAWQAGRKPFVGAGGKGLA